ncbi:MULTISPECIES: metalloregulator ArsR/SmtB family transcription factor [unclassified Campylobacter]|uniref:ArsR/SmtB family transcription factor n=1 Tax=unclassified Campylobacter TaxID=2593542 RepID=UPI001BDB336D|nr:MULTISPECIES: metalloregulator ArsR/SmtB family transcription factor [unclassified Campylobacter]MBZ7981677.1 winged helix-turn-helix transcriptional regulator [Campylobacter sp. RM12640]MBZ7983070.1 winged helix-turn-helix transcriptional regulator [Campylobacter sp. RM12647]MBZ7988556.1 winged helix-turn-helix transcriptional regulator [Campylobacter sp. RM12635]MBZ7990226.1 winged helix-turn-helix transcriptional regulator [Campylobacter sp. RM9331]MBZ7993184.1 winged helix-turn-helix tr
MKNLLNYTAAINDETRLKILAFLDIHKKCCVCEICESFEMLQSRISRHLKILKDADLLIASRDGAFIYYEINYENTKEILELLKKANFTLPDLKTPKECNS